MNVFLSTVRWDGVVQARNGFYFAGAFVALTMSALVLAFPDAMRDAPGVWVPAIVAFNLQITTFFFVAGLVLLERDEGTLTALAVSPLSARRYMAARIVTLTVLAAVETTIIVVVGFGVQGSWTLILAGTFLLGVIYTEFGVVVAARYDSINRLLLPASMVVTLLLLPLLPHFGLVSRFPFWLHPIEPGLTLIRAGYGAGSPDELAFAIGACVGWAWLTFRWAAQSVEQLMRDTRATGGR